MNKGVIAALLVAIIVILLGFYFVDVDVTDEGSLPDVNVEVEQGELPEAEVNTGSVDVGTTEETVTVPDVEVTTEEETVTVPTVDVEPAAEADETDDQATQ
ncbi:hypothetical protein ILP92_05245 [Maribius pontilimi]|uniref:Uncharacterized protein n=2 Tax=Palleronia pontilimi TaxID=1964209 RepID=A0A934IG26_9RHOB|nr:hypothetical protein [Palleronia pontilimi]